MHLLPGALNLELQKCNVHGALDTIIAREDR
jgi:hypothetical protein